MPPHPTPPLILPLVSICLFSESVPVFGMGILK